MAGTTASSVTAITAFNSSSPANVQWCALATEAGRHIDVSNVDAKKMILLVAADSTDQALDYIHIGETDTGDGTNPSYSAGELGALRVGCAKVTKGTAYAHLRSTATTHLKSLYVIGPFETARFKDSDGYINIAKGKEGSSATYIAPILLP